MIGLIGKSAPDRAASVGTKAVVVMPRSSCSRSTPPKKNRRFFRIGPPALVPN
jgi:hypothetical protein